MHSTFLRIEAIERFPKSLVFSVGTNGGPKWGHHARFLELSFQKVFKEFVSQNLCENFLIYV